LDRIRDLIDPYVLMDYFWEGRRPHGVYIQWVPSSILDEGYPGGVVSRFMHRYRSGLNWLRDDCFATMQAFSSPGWELDRGSFIVTLDYTGFYGPNHRFTLLNDPLVDGVRVVPRWWFIDEELFDADELMFMMNTEVMRPPARLIVDV
jgi:hypothetical protein